MSPMRVLKTLAVMAVLLALAAVPAMAQSELDQSQTTINLRPYFNVPSASQTFTAQKTGTLDKVSLYVQCCNDLDYPPNFSDIYVRVEGIQSDAVVGEGVLSSPGDFFEPTWMDVPLSPEPFVEAGKQYRLSVVTDLAENPYSLGVATSDVYPGGGFFYSHEDCRAGCESWDNYNRSAWDLAFKTYVTPDTTAPKVDPVTPADGTNGVARSSTVTANFSEAVKASTLTSNTFQLFSGNSKKPLKVTLSWNPATNPTSVTLTPSSKLDANTTYRVVISTGVEDLANNALDQDQDPNNGNQPKQWTFTTGSK